MTKHINIKVFGKVQGVGFRFSAHEQMVDLGLPGKVENIADGSILIDTEGEPEKLDKLIEWSHKGPNGSVVEKVEVLEAPGAFEPLKMG